MIRKVLFVSVLPLLLAVMMLFGYPGSTPTVQAAGTPGALVPLGDQLGDVGQYYSNISPFMKSRTYVYNTASSNRTVKVAIYDDKGNVVQNDGTGTGATMTCTVAGNRILYLLLNDLTTTGTLIVENQGGTGCSNKTGFHGVYHMKIWQTESGADLAVSVNTWTVAEQGQPKAVSGSYQAVPEYALQSEFALPMFLATRDVNNYWDTEVVVHNVSSSETVRVTFEWSADNAPAWANNNYADLLPNERRIFLASQLMYATGANGTLIEKNYWA